MTRILVTGGMGFIGSNFIHYLLTNAPEAEVTNFDALTYAGNPQNVEELRHNPNYRFVYGDLSDARRVGMLVREGFDAIVHFAAESHVDRSIRQPDVFVRTNVQGTLHLLEAAKRYGVGKFIHVSTDEVYGSLDSDGVFTEQSPLQANSPYSASKAASDLLARAYHKTFGLPVIISRCSNNYGPRQFPEKLIPLFMIRALRGRTLPLYGDGMNVRDWLHVEDHCRALHLMMQDGRPGEVYNVGGCNERTNLQVAEAILAHLNQPASLIRRVPDRLGHDRRYAIDPSKITEELGWRPRYGFEEGLNATLVWYLDHRRWWENILNKRYMQASEALKRGGST